MLFATVFVASTTELRSLQPVNGFALTRDNFGLPDKPDSHNAHRDNANCDHERFLSLRSGNTKAASDPSHGKGSPSTRPQRCGAQARVAGGRKGVRVR